MADETVESNREETKEEEIKERWTATYTLTVVGFFYFVNLYALRVNLSVAIVVMKDEFDWNEKIQGTILGAFFYGYLPGNAIGGRLAELFGGKIVTSISMITTALLALVSPPAVRSSTELFIAVRILQGITQGVCVPATARLFSNWLPKAERAKTQTRIYTGILVGTFTTLPLCGWLSESTFLGGWPSVFYTTGFFGLVMGIVFQVLITDDPKDMKRISQAELLHIQKYCLKEVGEEVSVYPWKAILASKQVWLIVLVHIGSNFGWYMLLTALPTFLHEILHMPVYTVGFVAGSTYFAAWCSSIVYSWFFTRLILNKTLTITKGRRISMALHCYGQMVGFICLLFSTSNAIVASIILIITSLFYSPHHCGMLCSPSDISPRFAGTVMGISNAFATIPGFVAPAIVGLVTNDNQTEWAWRYIFIITIACYVVLGSPYIFFYNSDILPWNYPAVTKEQKDEVKINEEGTNFSADNTAYDSKL